MAPLGGGLLLPMFAVLFIFPEQITRLVYNNPDYQHHALAIRIWGHRIFAALHRQHGQRILQRAGAEQGQLHRANGLLDHGPVREPADDLCDGRVRHDPWRHDHAQSRAVRFCLECCGKCCEKGKNRRRARLRQSRRKRSHRIRPSPQAPPSAPGLAPSAATLALSITLVRHPHHIRIKLDRPLDRTLQFNIDVRVRITFRIIADAVSQALCVNVFPRPATLFLVA